SRRLSAARTHAVIQPVCPRDGCASEGAVSGAHPSRGHTGCMTAWVRAALNRLLTISYRRRTNTPRPRRLVRLGVLGTWSTLTIGVAVGVTLPVLALVSYTGVQLARFERTDARRTMFVFAAPQPLTTGLNIA